MVRVVATTAVVFLETAWLVALISSVFSRISPAIRHPDPKAITNNDVPQHKALHFMAPSPWHREPSTLNSGGTLLISIFGPGLSMVSPDYETV